MAFGDAGMVEVFGGVGGHAELFHDAAGADVGRDGEGNDFTEHERGECVMHESLSAFCGVAVAPVLYSKAPADFDAGSEGGFKVWHGEAEVADEFASGTELGGEKTEAVALVVSFDAIHCGVGFGWCKKRGKEFHDARICVEAREGLAVYGAPGAEE